MKKGAISLRTISAVAMFLVVFMVLPVPTIATKPEDVTITMELVQGPVDPGPPATGTNTGTWSASGAFTDSGTVVEPYQMCGERLRVLTKALLTGAGGSIVIRVTLLGFTFISDTEIQFEGRWVIVGGTGQYANSGLKGQGTVTAIIDLEALPGDPQNFATLKGSVKL